MTEQPEALRLADWCEANSSGDYRPSAEAAAELRRLHAEVERLQALAQPAELFGYEIWGHFYRDYDEAVAAFKDKGIQWATPTGAVNGMNEDWVKENIREVYVHGIAAPQQQGDTP